MDQGAQRGARECVGPTPRFGASLRRLRKGAQATARTLGARRSAHFTPVDAALRPIAACVLRVISLTLLESIFVQQASGRKEAS